MCSKIETDRDRDRSPSIHRSRTLGPMSASVMARLQWKEEENRGGVLDSMTGSGIVTKMQREREREIHIKNTCA